MTKSAAFLTTLAPLAVVLVSVSGQEPAAAPDAPLPAIPSVPSMREPARRLLPKPPPTTPGMLVAPVQPRKAERLRPEFQPGNTYRFVVETNLTTRLENGAAASIQIEQQARYDAQVRVDGKKGVILRGRTERLDLTLSASGETLTFKSLEASSDDSPLAKHVRASLNRPVELALSESGRVDHATEGGSGGDENLMPGLPRFGPGQLVELIAGLPQFFSAKATIPGSVWSSQGSRPVAGFGAAQFDLESQQTQMVSFEGNQCHAIEFSGTVTGVLPDEIAPGSTRSVDLQSSLYQGRVYFDPLDRMVRLCEQTIELWITFPAEGEAAPVQVPVRQTEKLRLLHVIPTP